MNPGSSRPFRRQGATLVFALVILAVAAMVLAGLVISMGALVEHTVASQTAMNQRLNLENSRVLGVQMVRERLLSTNSGLSTNGPQSTGVTNLAVTNGGYSLGGIAMSGTTAWTTTNRPAGPNPFSPAGDTMVTVSGSNYYYAGYSGVLTGSLYSGTNPVSWVFEARTRTPTLGYDLANFFSSGTSLGISSAASVGTTNGSVLSGTLQNATFPPTLVQSGTDYLNAMTATTVSGTTTEYIVVGGTVTFLLNGISAERTFLITGSVRQVNFSGSNTHNYPLRIIGSSGLTASSTISLPSAGSSPIYLIHNNPTQPVTISVPSGAVPRANIFLISSSGTIAGSGTIRGGLIRSGTGGSLTVPGTVHILRETSLGTLDDVGIRRGWVESYRND
jgi:hypothetical protein